ncbi:hypothetical protein AALB53_16355 [Lachnospiraceae bacterium 47-T17]
MNDKVIKRISNGTSIELVPTSFMGINVYKAECTDKISYENKIADAVKQFNVEEFMNSTSEDVPDSEILSSLDTEIRKMSLFGG